MVPQNGLPFRITHNGEDKDPLTITAEWTAKDEKGELFHWDLGYFQLRGQELILVEQEDGLPKTEIKPVTTATLKTIPTRFSRYSSNTRDPTAKMIVEYEKGKNVTLHIGNPPTFPSSAECEWLMDFSFPSPHYASALVLEVSSSTSIEQYIDLQKTHFFRVDRMFNRVAPQLVESARREDGLEHVYDCLKQVQHKDTPVDDPHEDAFGRWVEEKDMEQIVHYHERAAPFAIYNWELGVHIPSLIVERLMATQQFKLALKVIRLVFDPSMDGTDINRCWSFPPFREDSVRKPAYTPDQETSVSEWHESGGNVHAAARSYPVAYMKRIAMKYVELMIAMGDEGIPGLRAAASGDPAAGEAPGQVL
ncbi:hypothetical protein EYZ11_010774 [Aspergillus tanneri]|uniref:Uncharacterized protein n=1 Tax=Aspergillus tanneri TaxID=1220188 RepID=A0A4S3J4H3_9EURO|nr:hypothetical protein EYZ11_010774 [Aspergillus tanneri]